jgi:hypothetical protein
MSIATYASQTLNVYITKDDVDALLFRGDFTVGFAFGGKVIEGCQVYVVLDEITRKVMEIALSKERKAFRALKQRKPKSKLETALGDQKENI